MIELGVSYMSDIAHKCLELEHQVEMENPSNCRPDVEC